MKDKISIAMWRGEGGHRQLIIRTKFSLKEETSIYVEYLASLSIICLGICEEYIFEAETKILYQK